MTSYKDYRLDQLGIASQDEADELEHALDIRFDQFTHSDRKDWVEQNAYLEAYAQTGVISDAAAEAHVTIRTAQTWTYLDVLGFRNRLEIAELRFSDGIQLLALERAREPNAPASLIIALLRMHLPEKFAAGGHVCDTLDTPDPEDTLFQYRQNATQQQTAGGLSLEDIAAGAYHPPHNPAPSTQNPSSPSVPSVPSVVNPPVRPEPVEGPKPDSQSTHHRHSRESGNPQSPSAPSVPSAVNPPSPDDDYFPRPDDDIQPVDPDEVAYFNLSPAERKTTPHPSASSAVNPSPNPPTRPIATLFQRHRRPQYDDDPNTFKTKRFH